MPPKKDAKKKKAEAKPPTLINGLTKEEISREQIEEHVLGLREVLDRERVERNYFQLERDKIQSFREVTDRKLAEVKAELKNLEKAMEDDEAHHIVGIKVFRQKMKHLLCEHHNTVTELEADIVTTTDVLEDEQSQLEADLYREMMGILVEMQESSCEDVFKELLLKHEEEMTAAKEKWERLLRETSIRNKTELQELEKEHDYIMKSVTCERELLWKSHFGNLNEDIDRCISDAKDLISMLSKDTGKEITALKECRDKKVLELKSMKEEFHALLKENKEFAKRVAKTENEFSRLERRSKSFSQSESNLTIPQKKILKEKKTEFQILEEQFKKLQIEVEELQSSVPKTVDMAENQADLSLRPLEDELMALNDSVEKVQAQLQAVISAPNVDQTAVTEITHKVEKELDIRNSAIKNLKHKRYLISTAHTAAVERAEGVFAT
ncbi:dynein regulatory complex subunit 4-like [Poeciliopsis prolifica]|uniref:dynein regulatory complex subunit 4-like n=1 Tax=Poeciliopsis prolifica TaxID=188132 RepID=UPI0024139E55|nr:dynein regulatory complex subunit 4-like [Poeciliopsis prolifica]